MTGPTRPTSTWYGRFPREGGYSLSVYVLRNPFHPVALSVRLIRPDRSVGSRIIVSDPAELRAMQAAIADVFAAQGEAAEVSKEDAATAAHDAARERIRAAFRESTVLGSVEDVAFRLGLPRAVVRRAIRAMRDAGEVVLDARGPTPYHRWLGMAPAPASTPAAPR